MTSVSASPVPHTQMLPLSREIVARLLPHAADRGVTVGVLAARIVEAVVEDRIVDAVLDDG